jgi:hypothetical protein
MQFVSLSLTRAIILAFLVQSLGDSMSGFLTYLHALYDGSTVDE